MLRRVFVRLAPYKLMCSIATVISMCTPRTQRQAQLVRSVGSTQRGRNTTPQERQTILQLIESLEQQNPTPYVLVTPVHLHKHHHHHQASRTFHHHRSFSTLCMHHIIRRPIDSPLLSGRWSLLYQAPTKEEDAVAQNPDTTLEGPVLARLRPVFGGFIRTKVSVWAFCVAMCMYTHAL